MRWLSAIVFGGGLVGTMLFLAGCASTGSAATAADGHAYAEGMMCPKCETVWVAEVTRQGTKVEHLRHRREMVCPDCDAMAQSQLLEDGKVMLHDCPSCKVTPVPLTAVERRTYRHPR